MPTKKDLIDKLTRKPWPRNYTVRELESLMKKCGCEKRQGGRGSGVKYIHNDSGENIAFDLPHPGHELYHYHVEIVIDFLRRIGEL